MSVPLQFRVVSGLRPFVPVKLNGVPFLFMVNADAIYYAMTIHANAAKANIGPLLLKKGKYGITTPGKVSPLGRATGTLKTLQVGSDVTKGTPIEVFEVPQTPEMDGMLGVRWLQAQKALVDFARKRLDVPQTANDAVRERAKLLAQGYSAHPMRWIDSRRCYTVGAAVNGVPALLNVSTAANMRLDSQLAEQAHIAVGPIVTTYGGPTGTTGDVRDSTQPITLKIDGVPVVAEKSAYIFDMYAYDAVPRPLASSGNLVGGTIGCNFMLNNHAVIDFGTGTLYLKSPGGKPQ